MQSERDRQFGSEQSIESNGPVYLTHMSGGGQDKQYRISLHGQAW